MKAKTKTTDGKALNEQQVLELLKQVLPKAIHDAKLAGKVYNAVERALAAKARERAFQKFCSRCELPDLEPKTVTSVQEQLANAFGAGDLTLKPDRRSKTLAAELVLPDGLQLSGTIKMGPVEAEGDEDPEFKPKFVPFPVVLPGDQELVWMLAKHEHLTPEEAGMNLSKVEEDFWLSKSGQKLIRDRVERCFPEFIGRVPAGMLAEAGLKRHYKTPEPLKVLRPEKPGRPSAKRG